MLKIFSQSFEDNIILSYAEQKEIALEKYPLSIPKAIMLMIQNPQTKLNGYIVLNLLIHSNASYKYTTTYKQLLECDDSVKFYAKAQLLAFLALGNIENFRILTSAINVDIVQDLKATICLEHFPILGKNKTMQMPANIILNLGKADTDFQKQEVYGMALLQKGNKQALQEWAKENKNTVKILINEGFLSEYQILSTKKKIPLSPDMIIKLGTINKSFQKQEVYGMALLQKGDEQALQEWAKKNKSTVKILTKEAYILDDPNIDPKKTIPMSPQMVFNLGFIDKEFKKQEVYGWALLKMKKMENFNQWSIENPENELSMQNLQWHTAQ